MTRIYLIRHAEAEGNLYRRAHGHFDGRITARGDTQIARLKKRFDGERIDAVYSSDLFRTRKTAAAVYEPRGLELITNEMLREVNVGCWEDAPWGEIEYTMPEQNELFTRDPARWNVEGCESFYDVRKRMGAALEDIAKRHDGESVAVFSHGFAIRAFLSGLLGIESEEISKLPYCDNTAVTLLIYENGKFEIKYQGDNAHLDAASSTFANQRWWKGDVPPLRENFRYTPAESDFGGTLFEQFEISDTPGGDTVFTVFAGENPAGVLSLDTKTDADAGIGQIAYVFVVPELRRQGLGVQLIGQALSVYRRLGREKLRLTAPDTSPAVEFCLKYGFTARSDSRETPSGVLMTLEKDI